MSSYTIRNIAPEFLDRLRGRAAADGLSLSAAILRVLTRYADHGSPEQTGAMGGAARAARMTPKERAEAARLAARARWNAPVDR